MSGGYCAQVLAKLWPVFTAKGCLVVGLSAVYKRNYGTADGSIDIDPEQILPLKFIKSSHADAALDKFLTSNPSVSNDNQYNGQGGLTAAFIMEGEMTGKAVVSFKVITDQHPITLETLQAFKPITSGLLGLSANLDKISAMPKFKPVLKELNARTNGIFN